MPHDVATMRMSPPSAPTARVDEPPGYYDVPMLTPPVWSELIAWYFFLGGLSASAFVTARLAERFGGQRFRPVARVGTCLAAAAILPCVPLLIADLGDRKRFHHMLRVFKPRSPMNLGAWTLTGYCGAGAAALAREWLRWGKAEDDPAAHGLAECALDGLLVAISDVAGVPLALLLSTYTGVLLSGASTPVWCKSPWLPPLFTAGAFSSGTAALSLTLESLEAAGVTVDAEAARQPLHRLNTASHLAESLALAGYLAAEGRPLLKGTIAPRVRTTALSIAGAEILKLTPVPARAKRWTTIAATALALFGAYNLRSTIVRAGVVSARDPASRY